eukprot:13910720-Alexandrium_andersonii.AAC.1
MCIRDRPLFLPAFAQPLSTIMLAGRAGAVPAPSVLHGWNIDAADAARTAPVLLLPEPIAFLVMRGAWR